MSLLSMLGINLPGLGSNAATGNPFGGLVGGGFPQPPTGLGGAVNPLVQALSAAFRGKLGEQPPEPASLAALPAGTTAPAYDPSGLPPLAANDPARPVETPKPEAKPQSVTSKGTASSTGKVYDDNSIPDSYYASIRSAESGGNDNAKNPLSSAAGRYQFTSSTWAATAKAHPELGLTPDGRFDPNQQERAIRAFTGDNAKILSANGIPLSGGSLYAAHFLGSGGATHVYKQPDNAMMRDVVGPGVVAANGFLSKMTVGDFKNWAAKKGGGGGASYAPTSSAASSGYRMGEGSFNTATNAPNPHANKSGSGGHGAPSSGDGGGSSGGGGSHKNSVSPDYKRYQARQNIKHLRNLSPVATIQALANIGKGLRAEGSKNA